MAPILEGEIRASQGLAVRRGQAISSRKSLAYCAPPRQRHSHAINLLHILQTSCKDLGDAARFLRVGIFLSGPPAWFSKFPNLGDTLLRDLRRLRFGKTAGAGAEVEASRPIGEQSGRQAKNCLLRTPSLLSRGIRP